MKKTTIAISSMLLLFAVSFSGTDSHAQTNAVVGSAKTKSGYEAAIRLCVDSLRNATPKEEHARYDSLLLVLYEEYKKQYLDLGAAGKWDEALPIALACEARFADDLPAKDAADLVYNVGYLYDKNGQYLQGLDYFHRAIARYEALHDIDTLDLRNDIALAYNNIGVAYAHTGFFTQRKESYLKAKEIWESMADVDKSNLVSLYGNLLRLYQQYGDRQAAGELIAAVNGNMDRWLQTGEFVAEGTGMDLPKPTAFYAVEKHRLNILYTDLISDKAGGIAHLDSLRTCFGQMSPAEQKQFSAYMLTAISHAAAPLVAYDDPAERRQKKQYLDLGMQESIRLGDRYNQMIFHSRLVSYYLDAESDKAKALSHLDHAIQIGQEMDIREFNLLNLYLKKGDVLQQAGRFAEAEALVRKSMSVLLDREVADPTEVRMDDFAHRNDIFYVNALRETAGLYKNEYTQHKHPEHGRIAQHFYDLSARLFHIYYQKGAYNPWLDRTNTDINEGLLSLHLALGRTDAVSLVNRMESNRSQHLIKEFEAKHLRFLHAPDSLFAKRNLLQVQLAEPELQAGEQETLHAALADVEAGIQEADAQFFTFFSDSLDVREIQAALNSGEYLVRYAVADEHIYAYTIQRNDLSIVLLGKKDTLLQQVEQYHGTLKNAETGYAEQARSLYRALIAPLQLPLDKVEKLIIIPEHKLNFIPFETLVDSERNQPLVAMCPVSYSHGLQLWLLQQQTRAARQGQRRFAAFAPRYSADYMLAFAGRQPNRGRLQDIAGATREAVQLAQYVDGSLYQGERAMKQDFIERATDYKMYHFAMHALLDESDHLRSSLVFQNGEHLRYHELYGLYFPAELVVLSACNTGMGKLENGEGLMSLSRALTYAGVQSSVYSLWEVPDEETAAIMLSFYEHLKAGRSKGEALTLAKRDFLENNPLKEHPFFWAGFVINGNTEAISSPRNSYTYLWLIGGGLVGVVLLLLLRKRRVGVL